MRPLSKRGFADSRRVADLLIAYPIQAIYSSPYLRAYQTIQPLAALLEMDIQVEEDLRERHLSSKRIDDFHDAVKRNWIDPDFCHPVGESNETVKARALGVFSRLLAQHGGESFVISSHGNFLALLMQHFDPGIDYTFWKGMTFPDIFRVTLTRDSQAVIDRLWH